MNKGERDGVDQEPPDNVMLSRHNAGLSKEAAIRMAISTARDVLAGIDGKLRPLMVVNRELL